MAKTKTVRSAKKSPATKGARKAKKAAPKKATARRATSKKSTASKKSSAGETTVTADRRRKSERRASSARREKSQPVATERRTLERREKVTRRRQIDPTTCERDYTTEEIEFMSALDDYKRKSGRMFPTCSEILEVFRALGYARRGVSEAAAATPPVFPAEASPAEASVEDALSTFAE